MSRKYPAPEPEKELSVEELLALPPLHRTFRYELKKSGVRKNGLEESEEAKEKRQEELETAKRKLRDLALGLK